MLRRTTPAVQLCNTRAAECERLAELAETVEKRDFYLGLVTAWRTLADQREVADRMQDFLGHAKQ